MEDGVYELDRTHLQLTEQFLMVKKGEGWWCKTLDYAIALYHDDKPQTWNCFGIAGMVQYSNKFVSLEYLKRVYPNRVYINKPESLKGRYVKSW